MLDGLPAADFDALAVEVQPLALQVREVLFRASDHLRYLYFPVNAVLSLTVTASSSASQGIEIATVGNEGVVGFTALLGVPTGFHEANCQTAGDCLRLPVPVLRKAMAHRPAIDRLVKKYISVAYRTVIQSAVCNVLHPVEQRLCRWLLEAHDKAAGELPITQDFLAARLGVQRPTVSLAASSLQKAGIISYHRGAIRVLDRAKLEQSACDCFKIIKSVYQRIMET